MAHPWHHAIMSARRFGGTPDDYLAVHQWMDYTKSHIADCRHRLFLHNAWGIYVAERILGTTLVRASDGKELPLRPTLEDHVKQDFGKIPTLAYCLDQLAPEPLERDMTIYEQCCASARRWGGVWTDYQAIHEFLDWPREQLADGRFRRIFHNTWGVYMVTQAFGHAFTRPSDGEILPVQPIAGHHIEMEYGTTPMLESCLEGIQLQRWMCVLAMPASVAERLGRGAGEEIRA